MSPSASSPTARLEDEPPKSSSLGLQVVKVRNNNKNLAKRKRKRPAHSPFASLFSMALEKRPALRLLLGNMRKTMGKPDVDHHPTSNTTCIENATTNADQQGKDSILTSQICQPIHHITNTRTAWAAWTCTNTETDLMQQQKDTLLLDHLEETLVTSVTTGSETTSECHSTADEEEDDKHCLEEEDDDNEEEQDKHSSVETETEMEDGDYNVPSNTAVKTALQTAKHDTELLKTELEKAIKSSLDYEWKYSDQQEELQKTKRQNTCLQNQLDASKRLSQLEAVLEINMEETWDYITVQQQEIMVARQHKDHLQKRLKRCQRIVLDLDWKNSDQQEELKRLQQEKTVVQNQLNAMQQQQRHNQEFSKSHRQGVLLELHQQQPWRVVPPPSPRSTSTRNNNTKSDDSEIKKQLETATKQCLDLDWRFTDQQEELLSTKQALEEARRQLAEQRCATTRL
jgi:hypothetical protein